MFSGINLYTLATALGIGNTEKIGWYATLLEVNKSLKGTGIQIETMLCQYDLGDYHTEFRAVKEVEQ